MRQQDPEERYIEVYDAIIAYKCEHDGCSPTMRELIQRTSYTSTSTVSYALRKLEERGLIKLRGGRKTRMIEVVGAVWTPPTKEEMITAPESGIYTMGHSRL